MRISKINYYIYRNIKYLNMIKDISNLRALLNARWPKGSRQESKKKLNTSLIKSKKK